MGHTVTSQRQVVEKILGELNDYGRSLRDEDREAFLSLLSKAKKHIASVSFSCSYNTWALVLFSMMLEMEKERINVK